MPEKTLPAPSRHLDYLDSARGIAALMVMTYHFINWKYEQYTGAKIVSILFNGSDAVSFFFVLSGFVLSYKYIVLAQPLDIRKFYITRFLRLWPAFFVTIVINAINWHRADLSLHTLTDIFAANKTQFWEEAILIRSHPQYYTPGWTLVIELSMSFFIPFWVALAQTNKRIVYWLLFAYLLIGNSMRDLYMFHFHFALGVLISCLFIQVRDSSFRDTKWFRYRYPILLVAGLLYSIRHIARLLPLGATYTYVAGYFGIDFFHYSALASFIFIIAVINSDRAKKILKHKTLIFFGKISYGIYLMHWLFATDIFIYWDKIRTYFSNTSSAFIIVFCIYAIVTILSATILHYTIELPFIKLGKRWVQHMKPSLVITPIHKH